MDANISAASNAALAAKQQQRKANRNVRAPLSCGPCRTRKLKCNREEPCQNCMVRKEPQSCVYAASRGPKTASPVSAAIKPQHAESMQQRIDRLESLVTSLASQSAPKSGDFTHRFTNLTPEGPSPSNQSRQYNAEDDTECTPDIGHGVGVLDIDENHTLYRGTTHWGDVFQELSDLKTLWSEVQADQDPIDLLSLHTSSTGSYTTGPPMLLRQFKPATFKEILATIPEKPALDRIIARFFDGENSPIPTLHILHKPTFMQQYEEHWANPNESKIMWVGLIFGIMSLVMLSYHLLEDEPPEYEGISERMYELYRLRTAQCLALGDMTACAPYTLETLLYYVFGEQARKSDGGTGTWLLWGMVVRIALQMGYHRDPSNYPNISLLQGELRRRVWRCIIRLDAVFSFAVGLPSMVRDESHDSQDPRNVYDWEMSETMTELPPSRPDTEITEASYLLAKDRMLGSLGGIVNLLSSLKPYPYEHVLRIDDELSQAHAALPPYLKMRPLEDCKGDPPSLISRRLQLEILFHQGTCILHRKFMAQGRLDGRFEPSRNRCIRSAMALLSIQDLLYQEAKGEVNDRIQFNRQWHRFSFTSQDFILGSMILALDLRHRKVAEAANGKKLPGTDYSDEQITTALERAFKIWTYAKESLPDAHKVYRVLAHMLDMLGVHGNMNNQQNQEVAAVNAQYPVDPNSQQFAQQQFVGFQDDLPFDTMNIDWAMWDSFIEGTSFEDAFGSMLTPPTTDSTPNTDPNPVSLQSDSSLLSFE